MGHQQDIWRENKMTPEERRLLAQSEVYLAEYEDLLTPTVKCLLVKSLVMQMRSDMLEYLMKHEKTELSDIRQQRIDILDEAVNYFMRLSSLNNEMKLIIRQNARERGGLMKEIDKLKRENEIMVALIKESDED